MAYFGNNLCNKGDGKCNDISICWDFTVFKGINFPPKTPAGGAQSTPPGPQLHLVALTCICLLRLLSQLGPDGPNCNYLVNALGISNKNDARNMTLSSNFVFI